MVNNTSRQGSAIMSLEDAAAELEALHRQAVSLSAELSALHTTKSYQRLAMNRREVNQRSSADGILKDEIVLEASRAYSARKSNKTSKHETINEIAHMTNLEVEEADRRLSMLNDEIEAIHTVVKARRKVAQNDPAMPQHAKRSNHRIAKLDNELERSRLLLNQQTTFNKTLRRDIENLTIEKQIMIQEAERLSGLVQCRRNDARMCLSQIGIVQNQMQYRPEKLSKLKHIADQERTACSEQWDKLGTLAEQHQTIEHRIAALRGDIFWNTREQRTQVRLAGTPFESKSNEEGLRRTLSRIAWTVARDRSMVRVVGERAEAFARVFEELQKSTGLQTMDALTEKFERHESDNIRKFMEFHELRQEIAQLESNLHHIDNEIDAYRQPISPDVVHQKIGREFENNVMRGCARTAKLDAEHLKSRQIISELCDPLNAVVELLKLESPAIGMLRQHGLTESNIVELFSTIEEAAMRLVEKVRKESRATVNYKSSASSAQRSHSARPKGFTTPPNRVCIDEDIFDELFNVMPPSCVTADSSDEDIASQLFLPTQALKQVRISRTAVPRNRNRSRQSIKTQRRRASRAVLVLDRRTSAI